jgi:DNA-binding MarR family transcriptional regulator
VTGPPGPPRTAGTAVGEPGPAGEPRAAGEDQAYRAVEQELAVLLRRARALSAEIGRKVHPELEIGAYSLLIRVDELGSARSSDLADYFGVGKATISRQLKVLEELGLIRRAPDPADGRAQLVTLTTEGGHRLHGARAARQERFRRLLATWGREDVELLARMLGRLNALTGAWDEQPGG